jgi:thiol:disulfide interchange protein DsbG
MIRVRTTVILVALTAVFTAVVTRELVRQVSPAVAVSPVSEAVNMPAVERATALLAKMSGGRAKVMTHFNAGEGLLGFVVQEQGKSDPGGIVYTNSSGSLLISASAIITEQGENLLQRDFTHYIQPEQTTQAHQTIAKTAFLEEGSAQAPHKMYVMLDPNCPHCHTAYLALQTQIKAGELAVRWIVVGNITSTSQAKALAILGADDPLQALQYNEEHFDMPGHSGGIEGVNNPSLLATSKLKANTDFLMANKLAYTPTFFFKTPSGLLKLMPGSLSGDALKDAIASAASEF